MSDAQEPFVAAAPQAPKAAPPKPDARARIVEALVDLCAERRFEEIGVKDIAARADVSLADFRDAFPSKAAVLAGLNRRIDRAVLEQNFDDAGDSTRDRLFDVLMRRLDAMAPYKAGLREIVAYLKRDPASAMQINRALLNSLRFMLEAVGIESEGAAGALKLQGLALAWARVVDVWLDDDEEGASRTMAALDEQLTRGERWVRGVDTLDRLAAPFVSLAKSAAEAGAKFGARAGRRPAPPADEGSTDKAKI